MQWHNNYALITLKKTTTRQTFTFR